MKKKYFLYLFCWGSALMAQHPSPSEILQKSPPVPQQIWCDEAEKNTALMDHIFGIMTEIEAALPEVQTADEA